jgi:RimJ/RimL family protein N-acetyltransferase
MKKAKLAQPAEEMVVYRPGGTDRAIRELAVATHRLTLRRLRDMLPGRIETKRLVLRAPIRGDVPELVRLADNPEVARWLATLPSPYTRADAIGFIEIIAQRPDERPYAITLSDKLIGVVGMSYAEGKPPEIGYWLGQPHWGQGYMTEAVRGLIDAAHRTGHYERIAAQVLADNNGSLHVLEKAGFRPLRKAKGEIGNIRGKAIIQLELERPRWM